MKKFCAAVLILIFASFEALAQTAKDGEPSFANRSFAPANEEFSIASCPVALAAHDALSGEKDSRRYVGANAETYFYVFSDAAKLDVSTDAAKLDISVALSKMPAQYKVVSYFAKLSQAKPSNFLVGDSVGEKYAFAGSDGFFHKILIVKTARRIYAFQTVSSTENDQNAERFFAGIGLNRRNAAQPTTAPEQKKDAEPLPVGAKLSDIKNGISESGAGYSGGNSVAASRASGAVVPSNSAQVTPLTLQSKPRADYTDFARFYEISGTVRLRVTFLATGEIGAVTPVSKLPFGLTDEAVKAARSIRFTPLKRDGQAYTIIKPVEYSFTIY